jgi:hypothetical protein
MVLTGCTGLEVHGLIVIVVLGRRQIPMAPNLSPTFNPLLISRILRVQNPTSTFNSWILQLRINLQISYGSLHLFFHLISPSVLNTATISIDSTVQILNVTACIHKFRPTSVWKVTSRHTLACTLCIL